MIVPDSEAPAWEPEYGNVQGICSFLMDVDAKVVHAVMGAAREVLQKEPKLYDVHGCLECGSIKQHYPRCVFFFVIFVFFLWDSMECVSIGPTIIEYVQETSELFVSGKHV